MAITDAVARALGSGMNLVRGRVAGVSPDGRLRVYLGADHEPEIACEITHAPGSVAPIFAPGDRVLVAAPQGSNEAGIVIGVIESVPPEPRDVSASGEGGDRKPVDEIESHRVSHRHIVVEAGEELTLKCGQASIQIRRDGKIVIRGEHILSRAKGTHRIKGGSVAIN